MAYYYGDPLLGSMCLPAWIHIPMSTAIARIYTPEGFVVAADGRAYNPEKRTVINETAKKIFQIRDLGRSIAYAIVGTVRIYQDGSNETVFDLVTELAKAQAQLETTKSRNILGYAIRLSRPINELLKRAKDSGRITAYPTSDNPQVNERGSTIAHVFLDGYYNDIPCRATIRFFHENQRLAQPEVLPEGLAVGSMLAYGSAEITHLLETEDARFVKYIRPKHRRAEMALTDAIETAKSYIEAHCDPEAMKIDEKFARTVGRPVHIATITPAEGFQWVPEFKPV
jgi:hypothetical protein